MVKIAKRTVAIILGVCLCIGLTGCSLFPEKEPDKSEPISVENIETGIYIMTADGKFYAPNTEGQSFSNVAISANPTRIVASYEDKKFIPTLYKDDHLVYFTKSAIPEKFAVERFRDVGFTTGLYQLSLGSDGNYSFNEKALVGGSLSQTVTAAMGDSNYNITIVTVNGKPLSEDMITEAGTIANLKKDENVKFGVMRGSYYAEFEAIADEHIYYSSATSYITTYKTTKNGYVVLQFPSDVTEGYISVDNTGLFYKSNENRPKS